jgi:hypothetical protein
MKRNLIYLSTVIWVLFFTGCVKTPNISYNAQMNKSIQSIAIVPPQELKEINIFYYNHPAINFGLFGGLIAAAEFSSKTKTYNTLIQSRQFNPNKYFVTKLAYYLDKGHYNVKVLPINKNKKNQYLETYPTSKQDAYLDLVIRDLGYIAGSPAATYKPTVKIAARFIKKSDKSILYEKSLAIGENFALQEEVDYLGNNEKLNYKDFDALKKDATRSVSSLKKVLDILAQRVAFSLKKSK